MRRQQRKRTSFSLVTVVLVQESITLDHRIYAGSLFCTFRLSPPDPSLRYSNSFHISAGNRERSIGHSARGPQPNLPMTLYRYGTVDYMEYEDRWSKRTFHEQFQRQRKPSEDRIRFGYYTAVSIRNVGTLFEIKGISSCSQDKPSYVSAKIVFCSQKAVLPLLCYLTLHLLTVASRPEDSSSFIAMAGHLGRRQEIFRPRS